MTQSVENDAPRPSSYLRLSVTTWPNPADPNDVQWRLRYGQPSKEDLLVAASFIHAYAHLIELPERRRNERVRQIRDRVTSPAECPHCGTRFRKGEPCPLCHVLPPADGEVS